MFGNDAGVIMFQVVLGFCVKWSDFLVFLSFFEYFFVCFSLKRNSENSKTKKFILISQMTPMAGKNRILWQGEIVY